VFEFDLETAELRKNGIKLRLQDQPRQVLVRLLACPGDVVNREELRSLLWSENNTFVDFESGLNTVVKRLRDALGDSADKPTFIETIPRKGYRFIAPVEVFGRNGDRARRRSQPVRNRHKSFAAAPYISAAVLIVLGGFIGHYLPLPPKVTNAVQLTNDGKAKSAMNLFVTDGVHLYFVEGTPWAGGSRIAQVSAFGGETTEIVTSLREILAIYAISPNFSELLIANGSAVGVDSATGRSDGAAELWAQPLPGGTPHRLGNIYASAACYTPDGTHILYADGHSLITINRDGSHPRELVRIQGVVSSLRYSPDGKKIRFQITNWRGFDSSSLWEIAANGNNPHRLLPSWTNSPFQCCGSWSPDGNYYFFQAGHGNDQAIWVMPEHRFVFAGGQGRPSRLLAGPLSLSAPLPSTNGKKLFLIGAELRAEPVRYDSKMHRFEAYLDSVSASSFEVSRDRNWIAYVSYPDMSLWRSRADGTQKMQLTFPPVRAYGPRWSPDGSKIAFTDVHFDRPWQIGLISSSGGPPQPLPSAGSDELQADPNWLPDGRSVIYYATKPGDKDSFGIFQLDLDSGKISPIPNSQQYFSPRVSPGGRYISAFSQAAKELLLFDSKTNQWSTLAKGELFSYNLWSDDGKYVYMRDNHIGAPRIVRVRIGDARMEEVLSLKDLPQEADIFAGWIGLTPNNEPIVIRDRSVQEIYALDLR
jgi:Tol biopolymer transport system component/DNA-binding winged helix-turn-helix (wHTH) protein